METMYAKSFEDTISALTMRRIQLADEEKELFCNVAKAFMEKYGTNRIEFNLDDYFPTLSVSRMDDDDADVEVWAFEFDDKGNILRVDGNVYYEDEDLIDEPFDSFHDIDYLDLAQCVNYQIKHGQYVE